MSPAATPSNPHAAELRAVLRDVMTQHRATWGERRDWPALADFQRLLGAAGWGAPSWPVEIGGRGLGVLDSLACDAEFARADAPRRVAVYGTNNVGPTIAAVGTPEQKAHLGAMLRGDEFWCQGFSEPDAGSDLASLRTRADVTDDGFVVNGQKVWTSIGMDASHMMLLARTDPDAPKHKGISALLVPLDTPGISRRPIRQINGLAEFAEVFFEDVFVPRDALLGPLHQGWQVTMTTLGFERAGVIGVAGELVDEVMGLVHSDASRAAGPVLRQRVVRLYSDARILQWMGERALANLHDPVAMSAVSSLVKLRWSLLGKELAELGADLHGIATVAGPDQAAGMRLLGSRANTIAGGTTEVMLNLLGERNLGLPREPR